MSSYGIKYTSSTGNTDAQIVGFYEVIPLLGRLEKLGAQAISVLAPNGDCWSKEEAMGHLGEIQACEVQPRSTELCNGLR